MCSQDIAGCLGHSKHRVVKCCEVSWLLVDCFRWLMKRKIALILGWRVGNWDVLGLMQEKQPGLAPSTSTTSTNSSTLILQLHREMMILHVKSTSAKEKLDMLEPQQKGESRHATTVIELLSISASAFKLKSQLLTHWPRLSMKMCSWACVGFAHNASVCPPKILGVHVFRICKC